VELLNDSGDGLPDWRAVADLARQNPEVLGAAPFVSGQALIARGSDMRGTIVRGIDPALEPSVTPIAAELAKDHWFNITAARRDLGYVPRISMTAGTAELIAALKARSAAKPRQ
jgi:ABC-type lipoprotein release transport system permease subunit